MKIINKILLLVLFSSLLQCTTITYLPKHDRIGSNPYGAYVKIFTLNKKYFNGELISSNEQEVKLLISKNDSRQIITIQANQLKRYYIIYAKKPALAKGAFIIPILHGAWFILTLIPNVIIMNNLDFTYTQNTLKYKDLKMFARFPSGIPAHIPENSIK